MSIMAASCSCAERFRRKGWQTTSLLARCLEHVVRRGARGCTALCIGARSTIRRNWLAGRFDRSFGRTATQPRRCRPVFRDRCAGAPAGPPRPSTQASQFAVARPRQWAHVLALTLWRELQLDQFWSTRGLGWPQRDSLGSCSVRAVATACCCAGTNGGVHRDCFGASARFPILLGEMPAAYPPIVIAVTYRLLAAPAKRVLESPGGAVERPVQHQLTTCGSKTI